MDLRFVLRLGCLISYRDEFFLFCFSSEVSSMKWREKLDY